MDSSKSSKQLMHDPQIIERVKRYLEEHVHQSYVDVNAMAKELQEQYREYSRRKFVPFRMMVEQAYKTVLHSYGLDSNPSSDENDDVNSDLELMENPSNNHVNNMLTDMYSRRPKQSNSVLVMNTNDGELIDISSDDSSDDEGKKTKAPKSSDSQGGKTAPPLPSDAIAFPKSISVSKTTPSVSSKKSSPPPVGGMSVRPQSPNGSTKKRKIDGTIPDWSVVVAQANTNGPQAQTSTSTKSKKSKREIPCIKTSTTFLDVGGIDRILKDLCELLLHIKHPHVYKSIGLPPPRGFLLHGPPGCGKTLLAHAIAGQLNIGLINVAATELVAGVSGESEERIRELFEQAASVAPCVLFIDEIDAISSNRMNAQKDMERRIVAQLISSIDNLPRLKNGDQVVVIGATNRPDVLDPGLRRVGRFDNEICLGIPDRDARNRILRIICSSLKVKYPFDFDHLAALTPGYVGADLMALASRAASTAVKRAFSAKRDSEIVRKIDDNKRDTDLVAVVNLTEETMLMDEVVALNEDNKKDTDTIADTTKETEPEEKVMVVEENGKDTDATEGKPDGDKSSNDETEVSIVSEGVLEPVEAMEVDGVKTMTNGEKKPEESTEQSCAPKITPLEETLSSALLKETNVKLTLTLDEMIRWLSRDTPPVALDELENLSISMEDFEDALKHVQPSSKREGFITVPGVTWDDVGSLRDIREELQLAVLAPVKYPSKLELLGLTAPSGVMLCGPPGCGKTLLAKAVANEAGVNFISVKGPELLNMYVGESERAVRLCFQRARNSAPCVIFFDEFDALCPRRSQNDSGGSSRVVNQLLTEMDGVEGREGVYLLAATNRPDMVDPAVLRPGRLDKILYVGLPEKVDRVEILEALTKKGTKPTMGGDVVIEELADLTEGYSGADLAGLLRQASLHALKEAITSSTADSDLCVSKQHFVLALQNTKPSVSEGEKKRYEKLRAKYAAHSPMAVATDSVADATIDGSDNIH